MYNKLDDFYFEIVNFPFLDVDVPRSTSYGVYISQLILAMLLTSTPAIKCKLRDFSNKVISIINFAKPFLNFIYDTMTWYLNSKLDSCAKSFRNLNSMVTWCIN